MVLTQNVVINSEQSMIILIIFIACLTKLKGSITKPFDYNKYIQLINMDLKERCKMYFFYLLIYYSQQFEDVSKIMILLVVDLTVDWIKHFFLVKMNQHPHNIIQQYSNQVGNFIYAVYHCTTQNKLEQVRLFTNNSIKKEEIDLLSHKLPD